ncbi:hypothetical protein [Cellulomonas endophytica]|uniref:hypothetical protein n=1 Tax=Cellulomonas endophytica TaxID=2494735 RepID=UPI0013E91EC4|nr:hypothetical protein [Cellulomonas endophytica]
MSARFNALVRFDVLGEEVTVTVGGRVEHAALPELCDVVERSATIAGRPALVDLGDAEIDPAARREVQRRCGAFARLRG